jgi:hypothetical protein
MPPMNSCDRARAIRWHDSYGGMELALDPNAVRTFLGLIRMAGLTVALAAYGLFGVPAPGRLA